MIALDALDYCTSPQQMPKESRFEEVAGDIAHLDSCRDPRARTGRAVQPSQIAGRLLSRSLCQRARHLVTA